MGEANVTPDGCFNDEEKQIFTSFGFNFLLFLAVGMQFWGREAQEQRCVPDMTLVDKIDATYGRGRVAEALQFDQFTLGIFLDRERYRECSAVLL